MTKHDPMAAVEAAITAEAAARVRALAEIAAAQHDVDQATARLNQLVRAALAARTVSQAQVAQLFGIGERGLRKRLAANTPPR